MGVILIVISIWNVNNGLNLLPKNPLATSTDIKAAASLESRNSQSETINLTYTKDGISNKEIRVKKNGTYKLVIDVKDTISGCMHMILIPGLDENAQPLDAGTIVTLTIHPTQSGTFPMTCAMGIPHGNIVVE